MTKEISFIEKVLGAFKNVDKEIDKGSSEHDVRYRFVKYFVENVLGYEPKYIKWEKKRADLTIIDENDLIKSLSEGRIGGAALDVREMEPPDKNDELIKFDNVIHTPHVAFYSEESLIELRSKAAKQMRNALSEGILIR